MDEQEYYIVRKVPKEEYMRYYVGKSDVKEKVLKTLSDEKYLLLQKLDIELAIKIIKSGGSTSE